MPDTSCTTLPCALGVVHLCAERFHDDLQVGLARVMERKQYRSSDEHAWTFVYAGQLLHVFFCPAS